MISKFEITKEGTINTKDYIFPLYANLYGNKGMDFESFKEKYNIKDTILIEDLIEFFDTNRILESKFYITYLESLLLKINIYNKISGFDKYLYEAANNLCYFIAAFEEVDFNFNIKYK